MKVFKRILKALVKALADEAQTDFTPPYTPGYRLAMTTNGKAPRRHVARSYTAVGHWR